MERLLEIILASIAIYATICLIWYIIMIIANWKIFTKAGQPGWMSIIPILNSFILFKISWSKKMFWVMLGSGVLGSIFTGLAGDQGGIFSYLGIICSLIMLVICLIDVHKISKSFGHGFGFTLGLIFLSPIFTLILGLGSSQYIGPGGETIS